MPYLAYISYYVTPFFFNDTATTEIYTLSLHDALPIYPARPPRYRSRCSRSALCGRCRRRLSNPPRAAAPGDRKSTRLNSSHLGISYAVFCLKKKKNIAGFIVESRGPQDLLSKAYRRDK